ncbi:FAEL335Cp [Eremothecium gossypii FDAG1]|nr:FAEL335Cp [Eremothecium gossypii FDAG1]
MIEYMEYVLRQFERTTSWDRDYSYENITATSDNLLQFEIPDSLNLQISNQSTPNTFNTFELSNRSIINGSLSYLYTDCGQLDKIVQNSLKVPLQQRVDTYQCLRPGRTLGTSFRSQMLLYGRMYWPGSILEAMYCKRLTPQSQLVLKSLLSAAGESSILTLYWQRNAPWGSQDIVFSTNELLLGYRLLHNLSPGRSHEGSPHGQSTLSLGAEFWLGISNLLPGCSTALRYCTHATNTGKPITLTLSLNPLFGHISSSYSVKFSPGTTFCSKYDFNVYSIESNLSFGCEFWKSSAAAHKQATNEEETSIEVATETPVSDPRYCGAVPGARSFDQIRPFAELPSDNQLYHQLMMPNSSNALIDNVNLPFPSPLLRYPPEKSVTDKFAAMIDATQFTSVLKMSSSLRDKNLRLLWEGKYKGFLVSAGAELTTIPLEAPKTINEITAQQVPRPLWLRPAKFGIQIQYST